MPVTTLNQAKRQLDKLKHQQQGPPPVTTLEIIDPATGKPREIYEVLPGKGWTLTCNARKTQTGNIEEVL